MLVQNILNSYWFHKRKTVTPHYNPKPHLGDNTLFDDKVKNYKMRTRLSVYVIYNIMHQCMQILCVNTSEKRYHMEQMIIGFVCEVVYPQAFYNTVSIQYVQNLHNCFKDIFTKAPSVYHQTYNIYPIQVYSIYT